MKFALLTAFRSFDWKEEGEHPDLLNVHNYSGELNGYKMAMNAFKVGGKWRGFTITFINPDPRILPLKTSNLVTADDFIAQIKKYGKIQDDGSNLGKRNRDVPDKG